MTTTAVILAAGKGTRMKSDLPKVLHEASGWPLVCWVVHTALEAGVDEAVVVTGYGREAVEPLLRERFGDRVRFALQAEQHGTGHAVQCAVDQALPTYEGRILVLYGDCPLIEAKTLETLIASSEGAAASLVTATLEDPTGYGRILRDDAGNVVAIREHRDASEAERAIHEVNPGLYVFGGAFLREALKALGRNNAQGELYLTDVIARAAERGDGVVDLPGSMDTLRGVNDRYELALCDAALRRRRCERLARSGVAIQDLDHTFIGADAEVSPGAWIGAGVHLRGRCFIGAGARIDVGAVLDDVKVAEDAEVRAYTVARDTTIGEGATVGPFTHLRPGTQLGPRSKVGNFCETKKTTLEEDAKVNHLAYVGDGKIGKRVNVGAGVIFCNYDGVNKHITTLEDDVFIGSDSQLVAPITVGQGAYVGSGSTITRDVPADALAVSRTRQSNKEGYAARLRARFAAAKAKK